MYPPSCATGYRQWKQVLQSNQCNCEPSQTLMGEAVSASVEMEFPTPADSVFSLTLYHEDASA